MSMTKVALRTSQRLSAIRTAMLASPNLIPGTAKGRGIMVSR